MSRLIHYGAALCNDSRYDEWLEQQEAPEPVECHKCECGEEATHRATYFERLYPDNQYHEEPICLTCIDDLMKDGFAFEYYYEIDGDDYQTT